MKNIFIILMVFCLGVVLNAQDYGFDKKCIEKSTIIKPKRGKDNYWERFIYLNTGNSSYYMTGSQKSSYFLTDNQKAETIEIQHFLVNGSSSYRALVIRKTDFSYKDKDIEKVTVEKTADRNFLVKTFPKKDGKRPNLEVEFTLKRSVMPLLQIRFMDLSPSIHKAVYEALLKELVDSNYQIETVKVDYRNGYQFLFDFTDCETVSLNFQFQDN